MADEEWFKLGTCSLKILNLYKNLIDSSVVDFYTKNLWSIALPTSWQTMLSDINVCDIIWILQNDSHLKHKKVFPLSLIALKTCINCYSIDRNNFSLKKLDLMANEFKSGLSSKKQHEILYTAETLLNLHKTYSVTNGHPTVVDIGSGHGHLSRYLAGCHNLDVISVDADHLLVTKASELNGKLFNKYSKKEQNFNNPRLINARLGQNCETTIFEDFGDVPLILVGLHACGDLSVEILQEFIRNEKVFGIVSVGCCYMKFTVPRPQEHASDADQAKFIHSDFPLSGQFKDYEPFSYFAKELACHANEQLLQKLKTLGNVDFLKIHCYRSVLELILTEKRSNHTRKPLKSVKNGHLLSFVDYAKVVLKFDEESSLTDDDLNSERVENCLKIWQNVVTYFVLRQILAPLIETAVLQDRALFIKENGFDNVHLFPIFDPMISARNITLMAFK